MLSTFFDLLGVIDNFFWSYLGIYLVLLPGIFFTIRSGFFQFKVISSPFTLFSELKDALHNKDGINPFKLFFSSMGGMVGLGNIVIIVTSVTAGGPGVLLWMWVASFSGMIIKYSEVYLGMKYRRPNADEGSFDGGPMFYLEHAFKSKFASISICILLCIYGVDVSQFKIITDNLAYSFNIDSTIAMAILLCLIFYASFGGIQRLANICTTVLPVFMVLYLIMCSWIIYMNAEKIPQMLYVVVTSAFSGHAPIFGFAGSSALMALHFGIARAVYSCDIGTGYDSVVQSTTKSKQPEAQAKLSIFAQLTSTIISTFSITIVLLTDVWHDTSLVEPSQYISKALAFHFPHTGLFMTVFVFMAGYTTIIAYYIAGIKAAKYINKDIGYKVYALYALVAFIITNFVSQAALIIVMSFSSGLLVLFNIAGIIKLRHQIKF